MNQIEENKIYKKVIRKSLNEDKDSFCPFRKERQMDYLFSALKPIFKLKNQQVLEAGCGYGRLIYFLNRFDSDQNYTGIDYIKELVMRGNAKFAKDKNINFLYLNFLKLPNKLVKQFDISILYKTLPWLPGYEDVVKQLIKVTKKKIFITGLFFEGDVSFITRVYTNARNNNSDYTFLNTYSLPKFSEYCYKLGAKKVKATSMHIDVDLSKPKITDKLKTYTSWLRTGERLEITGVNILNWKLIEITL